jgi:hypothetical protein
MSTGHDKDTYDSDYGFKIPWELPLRTFLN